ncbi:unnamed protein product [Penicillium salamii]|uniref:protein-tyrosine-phosphatase n=1 Tax=Penicillium salamii TaxID=1612424 RepID=A0A9W4NYH9_9EURO|nr:unnamed protein product [Penicillium salamii]CAG8262792.1 unnamed protein product [Penicillium salamii]CAG8277819.1 unnamed protein product [Penicillium salamii]CAG8293972.1 unnamed protein product [Penicillium salamii]CAG8306002.1 unnamed protein product [Penicillium salamii]
MTDAGMTGPRSPSSPWVQNPHRDGAQSFLTISPSGASNLDRSSPNYFGMSTHNSNQSANMGPVQKNWGHSPQSTHSPKIHVHPQELVSAGLVSMLKTEPETNRLRRESTFSDSFNGKQVSPGPKTSPSFPLGGFSLGQPSAPRGGTGRNSVSTATLPFPWVSPERCADLLKESQSNAMLFDVRPFAHFQNASIKGSLNLCIPTTLLKRPSFDTKKLQSTFSDDAAKQDFARWRDCKFIIVYDSASADSKDALPLMNVLNKFKAEEWKGDGLVLQGGFEGLSKQFPHLIQQSQSQPTGLSSKRPGPMGINLQSVAPVVGGCALPESTSAANPFFGNIRQNMDLLGGVGQIPLKQPGQMTELKRKRLPPWLQDASEANDKGHIVSDKFLKLEKTELERMKQALTYEGPSAEMNGSSKKYRVAGIEKGTKNRYNDIYPFDHSRVRLEGIPSGACDYVNANHISAELTHRKYIATQAPVPDTFNDFWRVVWEQDVRLLVSLTAEVERGQVKCDRYWESGNYGPFEVKAYSEKYIYIESHGQPINPSAETLKTTSEKRDGTNENPVIIVRHFSIRHTSFPFQPLRDITQLQYPYWPDFGTISQPTHLLHLIEQCNKVIRATSNPTYNSNLPEPKGQRPVLVHCSAGCGRTGTFCTVDSVLDMLKRQRTHSKGEKDTGPNPTDSNEWIRNLDLDLIAKTVEDFRQQRPSMVQNLSQYALCYESVLEWLTAQMN